MSNHKTPSIRFKEFTDDWEQRKVSDLLELLTDYDANGSFADMARNVNTTDGTGYAWYVRMTDLENPKPLSELKYVDETSYKFLKKTELHGGELLMAKRGNIGKAYIFEPRTPYATVAPNMYLLKLNDKVIPHFLYNYFISSKGNNQLVSLNASSTMGALYKDDVKNINVIMPSIEEQQKIGEYFSHLDNLITLHQRKYEKLVNVKKSMLDKMFPKNGEKVPEIRFKGFTDDWEQRKLEDFGKATGGTSIESEFSEDGIYKVISIGSYSENSVYNDQGIRAIKSDKTSNRILNRNDLTMILNDKTTSGNIIGRVLLIEESGIYIYNQRTERIEINLDEYDPVFLYEMLNAPNIREKIIKQAQGNTQIYVNWTAISLLEYMIPSKEEQVKIGEYLHSISNLITLHQRELEKLQNLKKSLLNSMFI